MKKVYELRRKHFNTLVCKITDRISAADINGQTQIAVHTLSPKTMDDVAAVLRRNKFTCIVSYGSSPRLLVSWGHGHEGKK